MATDSIESVLRRRLQDLFLGPWGRVLCCAASEIHQGKFSVDNQMAERVWVGSATKIGDDEDRLDESESHSDESQFSAPVPSEEDKTGEPSATSTGGQEKEAKEEGKDAKQDTREKEEDKKPRRDLRPRSCQHIQ